MNNKKLLRSRLPLSIAVVAGALFFGGPVAAAPDLIAPYRPIDPTINFHPPGKRSRLMFDFDSIGYSEAQLASVLALYDATVSHSDRLTGLILDALEQAGVPMG